MTEQALRLGIFGYGLIAGVHADALAHVPGVTAAAVCGPRLEAARDFAQAHGVDLVTTTRLLIGPG
jgi:predicted dehydrogenase